MPQIDPTYGSPHQAPVALFLRPAHRRGHRDPNHEALADWYGLHPVHVATLIAHYTREGDRVLDIDGHPTIAAATRHLNRQLAVLSTDDGRTIDATGQLETAMPVVRLVLTTLPRLGIDSDDVHALSRAFGSWRRLLRPGGFMITLLADGPGRGTIGRRSTVIAAARAAGLLYHQHIPGLLVAMPEVEPRAEPHVIVSPPLLAGRHMRIHRDLLAFASTEPEGGDA
ncbi:hypothetical protein [Paractinoplanes globisporus]|uniref:Methyltransferase n=1 Tax=Paractinoplanes globisporus TaxID=113565 RepID=A0ABW6WI86_9ACTN|nr:hypothetical protein [Actinoplanes globisporus]